MVVRCVGRESVLDCAFQRCFRNVFSPPPTGGTGWLKPVGIGDFLSWGHLGSNTTQQFRVWLTNFPEDPAKETRVLWHISECLLSPPSAESWGSFSPVFTVAIWWSSWMINLTILGGPLITGSCWSLNLSELLKKPPAFSQLQFSFCTRQCFPRWLPLVDFCWGIPWLPVFTSLSLHSWEPWFVLWPPFSEGSKQSCWFFSLFSFLFVVKMEHPLTSSLHAELETGCSHILVWKSFSPMARFNFFCADFPDLYISLVPGPFSQSLLRANKLLCSCWHSLSSSFVLLCDCMWNPRFVRHGTSLHFFLLYLSFLAHLTFVKL